MVIRLTEVTRVTAVVLGVAMAAGCSFSSGKRLVVPDSMKRVPPREGEWRDAADRPKEHRYVVRMAENGRVWEMELPEGSGGYEMRIPLGGGGGEVLTPADVELLGEAPPVQPVALKPDEPPKPARRSLLTALAKVNELYRDRRFELALIEAVELEKDYPQEARVHAMKGSLYVRLGKYRLAREAWTKALALNPNDTGVAEALRAIADREE